MAGKPLNAHGLFILRCKDADGLIIQLYDIARAQLAADARLDLLIHVHSALCNHGFGFAARGGKAHQFEQHIELDKFAAQWKIVNGQNGAPERNKGMILLPTVFCSDYLLFCVVYDANFLAGLFCRKTSSSPVFTWEIIMIQIVQSSGQKNVGRFALWQLGFRPFYLVASLFSAVSVLLWAAQFLGYLPLAYLRGALWHGHEMLFGYTLAVVAGFLLTAVRAWTNEPTPSGLPLMALVTLWLAGRVLVLSPFALTAMVVNAAFPLAIAWAIGVPLWRSRNVRNYFFVGLLGLMSGLVVITHLTLQGRLACSPRLGLQLGLDVVLFIMLVVGGRVIPMFTNNGVPGAAATRHAMVEKIALGSVIVLFFSDLLSLSSVLIGVFALVSGVAQATRLCLWKPWRTLATPLVWILHVAFLWIVIHLLMRGATELGWVTGSYATHALTLGAIGSLTLGMMMRTARGHTARPLVADSAETTIFWLVQGAAATRVFGGIVSSELYMPSVQLAALLWAAAFGLYAVRYWLVLTRPRLDGKPG